MKRKGRYREYERNGGGREEKDARLHIESPRPSPRPSWSTLALAAMCLRFPRTCTPRLDLRRAYHPLQEARERESEGSPSVLQHGWSSDTSYLDRTHHGGPTRVTLVSSVL